jgi:hypothetical protein
MDKNKLWLLIGALVVICGCFVVVGGGVAAYFVLQEQAEEVGSEVAESAPVVSEAVSEGTDETETREPALLPTESTEEEADSAPVPTSIPGWEKFAGNGVELWLPESYEGGNLNKDLDTIVDHLRELGPDFENIAQMIEQNPSAFALWAFDSEGSEAGFLTNINVTKEQIFSSITVDTYLDAAIKQFPPEFQLVDRRIVSLDRYEAGRLLVELTLSSIKAKEALYAIKDDDTMWLVVYATRTSEFEQRLPTFEQSVNTFVIQPE